MTLTTTILTDMASIVALVPEWDTLCQKDLRSTPYQSGSLTLGIGNLFSSPGTPFIVVARARAGELVGVLPLRRIPSEGRLGGHRLAPYTLWHSSYFDAILDPDVSDAGQSLHDALRARRDWDRCDLRFLRPDAHAIRAGGATLAGSDGASQCIQREAFDREGSGEGGPHKAARRLSKAGEVLFTAAEGPDQIESAVQRFTMMHTCRWKDAGEAAEFAHPLAAARLTALLRGLSPSGLCRIGTLRLSGEIIAVHVAFRWRDTQFSWRMSHDVRWQAGSPGRLLMSLMIEDAFDAGCRECDLGRGLDSYKRRWPTEQRRLSRVVLRGATLRGRLGALRAQL